jgi:hypothetical protein
MIFTYFNRLFGIVDFIEQLVIQGGEAFMHPDIDEIILEATKYQEQFDHLMFITNGTYIPRASTIALLRTLPCKYVIRIDDYGRCSTQLNELLAVMEANGIPADVRLYNESEQYCGGWVDVIGSFEYKEYSEEQLEQVFRSCLNRVNCKFVWDGKLYGCGMHGAGCLLNKVRDTSDDSIDLLSDESMELKRAVVLTWGGRPYEGCKYCNGFDPDNSPRIPAAEQIV